VFHCRSLTDRPWPLLRLTLNASLVSLAPEPGGAPAPVPARGRGGPGGPAGNNACAGCSDQGGLGPPDLTALLTTSLPRAAVLEVREDPPVRLLRHVGWHRALLVCVVEGGSGGSGGGGGGGGDSLALLLSLARSGFSLASRTYRLLYGKPGAKVGALVRV
jgi:hypothetical protein